ncbi:hypothetical protein B7463_g8673, partial [Scytalidium lignicola]
MLWGEYPALVDGELGEQVHGMAYEVQTTEEAKRLEYYETEKYEVAQCVIKFEDGTEAVGKTFKWADDQADLKEGHFDLKDWKLTNLDRNMLS